MFGSNFVIILPSKPKLLSFLGMIVFLFVILLSLLALNGAKWEETSSKDDVAVYGLFGVSRYYDKIYGGQKNTLFLSRTLKKITLHK